MKFNHPSGHKDNEEDYFSDNDLDKDEPENTSGDEEDKKCVCWFCLYYSFK